MSAVALEVRDLCVSFPSPSGRLPAVDRVSFRLRAGEMTGLVGESGCGKSATAMALMGLFGTHEAHVEAGSVRLAGQELCGPRGYRPGPTASTAGRRGSGAGAEMEGKKGTAQQHQAEEKGPGQASKRSVHGASSVSAACCLSKIRYLRLGHPRSTGGPK